MKEKNAEEENGIQFIYYFITGNRTVISPIYPLHAVVPSFYIY